MSDHDISECDFCHERMKLGFLSDITHDGITKRVCLSCESTNDETLEAIDWLMAVRKYGIVKANEMFPGGKSF